MNTIRHAALRMIQTRITTVGPPLEQEQSPIAIIWIIVGTVILFVIAATILSLATACKRKYPNTRALIVDVVSSVLTAVHVSMRSAWSIAMHAFIVIKNCFYRGKRHTPMFGSGSDGAGAAQSEYEVTGLDSDEDDMVTVELSNRSLQMLQVGAVVVNPVTIVPTVSPQASEGEIESYPAKGKDSNSAAIDGNIV